jgi:hypothetical protein
VTVSKTYRRIAAGLGVLSIGTLVAACDKPQPKVTVFNGSGSKIISAQPGCVTQATCSPDVSKIPTVFAHSGSTLLIDVPKEVADKSWLVQALNPDSSGKVTAIEGAGTIAPTKDHAVRVLVPTQAGVRYILRVTPTIPKPGTRVWMTWVEVTQ